MHYRRGGVGPALVLLHESPLSSLALVDLASSLTDRFTVIALDTPGYGNSDPLSDLEQPEISDFAAATADTLGALGVERCVLYGALTGASIALELARSRPDLVAGLTLDFLPWFSAELRASFLEMYLPLFPVLGDGSHLVSLWARMRDQYAYLPWFDRRLENRMDVAMPSTQLIHDAVMDMLRAGEGYQVAYSAAFRYPPETLLGELRMPTALVAPDDEVLAAQRERLPSPPVCVASARLPGAREAESMIRALGDRVASQLPDGPPDKPAWEPIESRITRSYVDTSAGQLHVRGRSGEDVRPVVLLHASPGSARMLHGLIEQLMPGRPVLAFDTLGNGESDKPPGWERGRSWEPTGPLEPPVAPDNAPWDEPRIHDYAAIVAEAIDSLGHEEVDLYGSHTGGAIAIETAIRLGEGRVRSVIVDGLARFSAEERDEHLALYTPPLEPRWDGSHLVWAWSFLEAQNRFWPWYAQTREGIRWVEAASPEDLHTWVIELLKSAHTYPLAYRAAFAYPMADRLPLLTARTLVGAVDDDPLAGESQIGARLAPNATAAVLPHDIRAKALACERFLDASA